MTYRVTGSDVATTRTFERVGVQRYPCKDGRMGTKDIYSKPAAALEQSRIGLRRSLTWVLAAHYSLLIQA